MDKEVNEKSVKNSEIKITEKKNTVVTGNKREDLKNFLNTNTVEYGIMLLSYYVPRNTRLISYCKKCKKLDYITLNLKAICNG